MTIHGVIALITFFESWINTPSESIPEPGSENKEDEDDKKEKSEEEGLFNPLKSLECATSTGCCSLKDSIIQKFRHSRQFYFQFHVFCHW